MNRITIVFAFLNVILSVSPSLATAQDTTAEVTPGKTITPADIFGGFIGDSMQAQLTEMATKMIDGYLDYLAKPQTAKKLAMFQKNYYDALIEQGFTKEQAFELLLRFGNPLADGPRGQK